MSRPRVSDITYKWKAPSPQIMYFSASKLCQNRECRRNMRGEMRPEEELVVTESSTVRQMRKRRCTNERRREHEQMKGRYERDGEMSRGKDDQGRRGRVGRVPRSGAVSSKRDETSSTSLTYFCSPWFEW